jgi:SP family sugar:H+ symporter-like MFS transporter
LGSIVQITSGVNGARYYQLVGGKIIVTLAVGLNSVNIPVFLSNCSPAAVRGAVVNSYTCFVGKSIR